jgi:hypothetical protein
MSRLLLAIILCSAVTACATPVRSTDTQVIPRVCTQPGSPRAEALWYSPTDSFLNHIGRSLLLDGVERLETDTVRDGLTVTLGPPSDSLRSVLLSLAMYPPLLSTTLAGRAAREFLRVGGKPTDLVWAAENALTLDLTWHLLRSIPDGAVPHREAFVQIRCAATEYLHAFEDDGLPHSWMLGEASVAYASILDEIDRIVGSSESP